MTDKKTKTFLLEFDEEILREIRIRAAIRNISMRSYMVRAVLEQLVKERKYDRGELYHETQK